MSSAIMLFRRVDCSSRCLMAENIVVHRQEFRRRRRLIHYRCSFNCDNHTVVTCGAEWLRWMMLHAHDWWAANFYKIRPLLSRYSSAIFFALRYETDAEVSYEWRVMRCAHPRTDEAHGRCLAWLRYLLGSNALVAMKRGISMLCARFYRRFFTTNEALMVCADGLHYQRRACWTASLLSFYREGIQANYWTIVGCISGPFHVKNERTGQYWAFENISALFS